MTTAVSFRNVSFGYGDDLVVDNVNFDIAEGEVLCLLGPSGCGKTSSLRLAAGMEKPSTGEIWLGGECVSSPGGIAPPETRNIGFLFQEFALFPHLTVFDNICFGLKGLARDEQKARAIELMKAVGLSGLAEKYPNTLSGGEQQRAALARALAPRPALLLMDEPFSNLDPQLRDRMRELTLRLLKQYGAAGLIVTHDAADAFRLADKIAVQKEGRILKIDTPHEIYKQPAELDVAVMFGMVNIIQQDDDLIGVRPHDVRLSGEGEGWTGQGDIIEVRSSGASWLCKIRLSGGEEWEASFIGDDKPTLGTHNFFVRQADLMLFKS